MKKLALWCLASVLAVTVAARPARAVFTFTLSQLGSSVVVTGSGSFNTTALTLVGTSGGGTISGALEDNVAYLTAGPSTGVTIARYSGILGPANFGAGMANDSTTIGSGSVAGLYGSVGYLYVFSGYASGTALSDSATYNNTTLSNLGLTPGNSFTYTWGSGATADSLTVNVVPEPSACALVAIGAAGICVWGLRRRRASW